jgi:hypothetical protein
MKAGFPLRSSLRSLRLGGLLAALLVNLALLGQARASEPMNACGCYRNDQGACVCTRKSKCGCPEECEPMGCEVKRQREADRAADAALKQIAERERKKASEMAEVSKKAAKARPAPASKLSKRERDAIRELTGDDKPNKKRDPGKKPSDDPLAQ